MRRFLVFPPLLAVWFVALQLVLRILISTTGWLAFRTVSLKTDVYWVEPRSQLTIYLPSLVLGLSFGAIFATLDWVFHPNIANIKNRMVTLTRHLAISGLIAFVLVLLCHSALLPLSIHYAQRRYHAYAPELTYIVALSYAQNLLMLASVVWAMLKTLRPSTNEDQKKLEAPI